MDAAGYLGTLNTKNYKPEELVALHGRSEYVCACMLGAGFLACTVLLSRARYLLRPVYFVSVSLYLLPVMSNPPPSWTLDKADRARGRFCSHVGGGGLVGKGVMNYLWYVLKSVVCSLQSEPVACIM